MFGEFGAAGAGLEQGGFAVAQAVGEAGDLGAAGGRIGLERRDLGATVAELLGVPGEVEVREAVAEAAVAQGLGGLTAEEAIWRPTSLTTSVMRARLASTPLSLFSASRRWAL